MMLATVPIGDAGMNDMPLLMPEQDDGALSFARGFVKSEAFMLLFREGMGLVEQTASYLDGAGRAESAALPREIALTYATESMRLTTRLMQIASWLLVQRAVAEGEMTADQARTEKNKVKIAEPITTPAHEAARLPQALRDLVAHSVRLQDRIRHLEGLMSGAVEHETPNPVLNQIDILKSRLGMAR